MGKEKQTDALFHATALLIMFVFIWCMARIFEGKML